MKKFVAFMLLMCMMLAMTACGSSAPEYKLGMGVVVSTDSSADNLAQVDATVAAVVLDAQGKIVACRLDCAQNKMDVTGGAVDTEAAFKSKVELGYDYNMVKFSDATLEWFEQAEGFEAYVIGKTAEEVAAIETTVNEEGNNVAVDEALFAACSISIEDFVGSVVKACNDPWAKTFTAKDFKLGVAAISTADESTPADEENDAAVKMYTEFAAAATDADGVILAAVTDAIQPVINVNLDGQITDASFKGTKRELGDDYNMVKFGAAIAEWDAQADAFASYTIGKTANEVLSLETIVNEEGNQVTVDEDLFAVCTMSIGGMMAVIAQAANYAR